MRKHGAILVLIASVIPVIMTGPAFAGTFEDASEALRRGDYKTAFQLFAPLAEQGNVLAQFNLGLLYENGKGVRQDYAEAAKWYRKAAEQGNAKGQSNLGIMYQYGKGVRQDYAEAAKWYRMAVERGNAPAQLNLWILYHFGRGVPQDDVEAAKWCGKAAEQGIADAQFNLALMYENGKGVPQDNGLAHRWFDLAALRFPASQSKMRVKAERNRDEIALRLIPSQIAEAQRLGLEWKAKEATVSTVAP